MSDQNQSVFATKKIIMEKDQLKKRCQTTWSFALQHFIRHN